MDKNKIFLISRGELEGRLDSYYYNEVFLNNEINLHKIGYTKFGEFIRIITKGSTPEMINEGIPFLKVLNMNEFGIKTEKLDYISLKTHESMKRSQLHGDEILYSMAGTIGIALNYDKKFEQANINQAIAKIVLNEKKLNVLMVYLLNSKLCNLQAKRFLTVSAQPNINFEQIKSIKIPKISENQKIDIINTMNNAYEVKKQKEKEAKDLLDKVDNYLFEKLEIKLPIEPVYSIENRIFKVGFNDILGDRLDADSYTSYYQNIFETFEKSVCKFTTLKTITKKIKTGTTPEQKLDAFTTEKEIPFLRNSDIQDGEIIDSKFKYIKNEVEKNLTFSYKNEIIICIAGTIGVSALNRFDRLATNQNVSSLTIDETQINIKFLIYWLNTKVAISLLKRLASIATIAYVNNPTLLRLQIPLPDINVQNEIANEIKQRREKAKQLQNEAKGELENAKKEVEKIILGEDYES